MVTLLRGVGVSANTKPAYAAAPLASALRSWQVTF
jgi:hypothetical protein